MKTWGMIKDLTENRDNKFKCTNGCIIDPRRDFIIGRDKEGYIRFFEHGEFRDAFFDIHNKFDWDWELVRQPVDFLTAVNSGKEIRPDDVPAIIHGFNELGYWALTIDRINGLWLVE